MEWFDRLFGNLIDSSGQLNAAKAESHKRSPEMEKAAKARGFKSAEEMILFERRRQDGGSVNRSRAGQAIVTAKEAYDRGDAMAWHPMNLLDRAAAAFERTRD